MALLTGEATTLVWGQRFRKLPMTKYWMLATSNAMALLRSGPALSEAADDKISTLATSNPNTDRMTRWRPRERHDPRAETEAGRMTATHGLPRLQHGTPAERTASRWLWRIFGLASLDRFTGPLSASASYWRPRLENGAACADSQQLGRSIWGMQLQAAYGVRRTALY